jgi:primosomal protein N' (replication factor Y)
VTGSGKTEVYLCAIERVLEMGRNALVLVPEISLTPQTVERFKSRFNAIQRQVAVLHSHLSAGERHDEWHKIRNGKARIVIGARSAVFAPLEKLGLIVVDEEHEGSYKQDEAPRYHARDVAVVRAAMEKCPILLGSATPSLESFYNTVNGKYDLLRLTQRADDRKMPVMRVVDLRLESRGGNQRKGEPNPLSAALQRAVFQRLERGEQCILFLNRRGFSPSIQCLACGEAVQCPHCSVSVTYHRKDNFLACHLCGYTAVPPKKCPSCGDPAIRFSGFGTEKVEGIVRRTFAEARVARLDADMMVRRNTLRETLQEFRTQKIDILVGTQMIAKGLHFPNVTLVGILNADMGLHMPDYRAGERTFQLLTQVAGRAGRGEVTGEVFVQTFSPHHAAIQFARHHDFDGFYEAEAPMRQGFGHPPFAHMILLTVRGKRLEVAQFTAETLATKLRNDLPAGVEVHPATPAPLEKVAQNYRFQVSLRAKGVRKMASHVRNTLDALTLPRDIYIAVDVDPYDLL